jgi:hypothetical protein
VLAARLRIARDTRHFLLADFPRHRNHLGTTCMA